MAAENRYGEDSESHPHHNRDDADKSRPPCVLLGRTRGTSLVFVLVRRFVLLRMQPLQAALVAPLVTFREKLPLPVLAVGWHLLGGRQAATRESVGLIGRWTIRARRQRQSVGRTIGVSWHW
jgi:hypothetical protein